MSGPFPATKEPIFCTRCGQKLVKSVTAADVRFDAFTGERSGKERPTLVCGIGGIGHDRWTQQTGGGWRAQS